MTSLESRVRALLSESGITGPDADELAERLTALEKYVDDTPPEPSPQLAATMARKAPALVAVAPPARRRGRLFVASLVAAGAVGAGGVAAAANELPPSAQDLVAELSERYLPFSLPRPTAPTADEAMPAGVGVTPWPSRESPGPGSGTRPPREERPTGLSPTVPDDPTLARSKAGETSSDPVSPEEAASRRVSPEEASAPLEEPTAASEPAESQADPEDSTVDGDAASEGAGSGAVDGAGSPETPDSSAAGAEGRSGGDARPAAGESSVDAAPSSGPRPATARRSSAPPSRAEERARDDRGRAAPR